MVGQIARGGQTDAGEGPQGTLGAGEIGRPGGAQIRDILRGISAPSSRPAKITGLVAPSSAGRMAGTLILAVTGSP
jgi:hypothetical protein